jgi:hypothetical protein
VAIKYFTTREFGGGLNTATDKSLIEPNQSPSMSNMDVTLTNALRRRDGYAAVTTSPIVATSAALKGLWRFYLANGTVQWVTVCGTALWAMSVNSAGELARKEMTTVNATGTTAITDALYSGGAAVYKAGTLTCTVPSCNYIAVGIWSLSASAKVDSGAWASVTNTTGGCYTWVPTIAGTAAAHTISLKPPVDGGESLKITGAKTVALTASRIPNPYWSLRFYDDGANTHSLFVPSSAQNILIYSGGGSVYYNGALTPRSVGWHTITTRFDSGRGGTAVYIDGSVSRAPHPPSTFPRVIQTGTGTSYIDNALCGYGTVFPVVLSTCATTTGWTASGTGTLAVNATTYDPLTPHVMGDWIDHGSMGTFARKDSTLSASATSFSAATINNRLYYSSDWDAIRYYDGSTTTAVTASTDTLAAHMVLLKQRLFGAGDHNDPSQIEATSVDNGSDWSDYAARLAGKDSGGNCRGLAVWDSKLFYLSESKVYALDPTGVSTGWAKYELSSRYGCIASKSLASFSQGIIFLSQDGVRAYGTIPNISSSDGSGLLHLSQNINLSSYTDAQKTAACGTVYRDRYWLHIGRDTYVADLTKRVKGQPVWVGYSLGITPVVFVNTRGDETGLYCGATDNRIYHLEYGDTDNGANISSSWTSAPLGIGGYASTKHGRTLHVGIDSAVAKSVTVTPLTDDVSGNPAVLSITGTSDIQLVRAPFTWRGRALQLTISASSSSSPMSISELTLAYVPPRMR